MARRKWGMVAVRKHPRLWLAAPSRQTSGGRKGLSTFISTALVGTISTSSHACRRMENGDAGGTHVLPRPRGNSTPRRKGARTQDQEISAPSGLGVFALKLDGGRDIARRCPRWRSPRIGQRNGERSGGGRETGNSTPRRKGARTPW